MSIVSVYMLIYLFFVEFKMIRNIAEIIFERNVLKDDIHDVSVKRRNYLSLESLIYAFYHIKS